MAVLFGMPTVQYLARRAH